MTISYNWLKNYFEADITLEQISETLTSTGLEVEYIEKFESIKGGLEKLVIGEVLTKEKHPNADKLSITTVNLGSELGIQKIVCGAPNVAAGQRVVVAPVGATVHPSTGDAFEIKAAKIRGEESNGMICAEDEIGLGQSHDGILVLPNDAPIGMLAAQYFNVESDHIIEIGLTPNRTDAMSHIGIARDLVAGLKSKGIPAKFIMPNGITVPSSSQELMDVDIQNTDCKRFSTVVIDHITISDSPKWMMNRLKAIGIKPINNIVDITNYVLHEFGQPLHAYDFDNIEGKLIIKKAIQGSVFKLLDGNEVKLNENDLMVCDQQKYLCIAGVYGGLESGVKNNTKKIVLESAHFDAVSVRKTSQFHNLRTDAAQKFEKCADINITIKALQRALELIKLVCPEMTYNNINDVYSIPVSNAMVTLRFAKLNQIAGMAIQPTVVKSILLDLGIEIKEENNENFLLSIPTFKADVIREEDVIEEILRIFGYNNIPFPSFLRSNISFSNGIKRHELVRNSSNYLIGKGYSEIMTNSIAQSQYSTNDNLVKLLNSMTAELDSLRTSLVIGGLEVLKYNINRDAKDLRVFEIGNIYGVKGEKYEQESKLCIYTTGKTSDKNWIAQQRNFDFYDLKSMVENLLKKFLTNSISTDENSNPIFSYGIQYTINKKLIAQMGLLSNGLLKQMDIKQPVFYAEIDFDYLLKLVNKQKVIYSEVSKFPSVQRDLALILPEEVTFQKVEQLAHQKVKNILQEIGLFDVYKGEKLGANKKSYAVSFKFQDKTKTLTDKEIEKAMSALMNGYELELNAEIRRA